MPLALVAVDHGSRPAQHAANDASARLSGNPWVHPSQAIWLELQDAVHAVDAMTTKTPEEAAK
jgi:hypothetical protein